MYPASFEIWKLVIFGAAALNSLIITLVSVILYNQRKRIDQTRTVESIFYSFSEVSDDAFLVIKNKSVVFANRKLRELLEYPLKQLSSSGNDLVEFIQEKGLQLKASRQKNRERLFFTTRSKSNKRLDFIISIYMLQWYEEDILLALIQKNKKPAR